MSAREAWRRGRGYWRRSSLRTKIHLSYLGLISVPLLVVALAAYQTATSTIEQNAQGFSFQLTGEIRKNLDLYTEEAERLTYWPFQAADIQRVLQAYQLPGTGTPRFGDVAVMKSELSYLGHSRTDVAGVYVVTRNGTLFSWTASGDLVAHPATLQAPWVRHVLGETRRTAFLPTQGQQMISVATGRVFSLTRALLDARSGAELGAVRIDLDASALARVVQRVSLGAGGRPLVVTAGGQVVYPVDAAAGMERLAREITAQLGARQAGRLRFTAAGQDLLATYATSTPSGWIVASVVPRDQLLVGTQYLGAFILTVAVLCIVAGAVCATFVVGRLTQPLRLLRDAMGRVGARDLDTRVEVRSEDEVGQLAGSFNAMLDELRRLVDDVLRAQIHEREAELQALQNQINPHFLYNTLESINMLALTHGDRDISRMVTSLGRLLRLTISPGPTLIPLREELAYINHYFVVQRMRYGDRITMTIEVDDSLACYLVPKLTLQPLVENAIYHGLEPKRGAGRVMVRGRRDGTDLVLDVLDDGVGMDGAALAEVQAAITDAPRRGSRSVGLANVQQRLQLYCGTGYGLRVGSTPGVGTQVEVRLPPLPRVEAGPEAEEGSLERREDDHVSLAHRRR